MRTGQQQRARRAGSAAAGAQRGAAQHGLRRGDRGERGAQEDVVAHELQRRRADHARAAEQQVHACSKRAHFSLLAGMSARAWREALIMPARLSSRYTRARQQGISAMR
jgi:hypothetical protein